MARRRFLDTDDFKDLPVGTHEPCRLSRFEWHEAGERKEWMKYEAKPYFRLEFAYDGDEPSLFDHSATHFLTESESRKSKLNEFIVELNGGSEPEDWDPEDFVGKFYRVKVRKKLDGKTYVAGVEPCDSRGDVEIADTDQSPAARILADRGPSGDDTGTGESESTEEADRRETTSYESEEVLRSMKKRELLEYANGREISMSLFNRGMSDEEVLKVILDKDLPF